MTNKDEDIQLIELIKEGDQKAFEQLIKKYKNTLTFTVQNIVRDERVAEDIVVETFMKIFVNIESYNPEYSFSTWLFTIATNAAIDHTRLKKHIRFKSSSDDESELGIFLDTIENKGTKAPDEPLIDENKQKIMQYMLSKLRPDYRKIIELRYFEDLSYKDIADELGISVSMVKTKLHRAKKK